MSGRWVVIVVAAIAAVSADTPANCTYEDIKGTWTFSVGMRGNNRSLNCSSFKGGVTTLQVTLYFPDLAVDQYGNEGFWTLIYNQGFEFVIKGRKYFAFSKYRMSGKAVTSICDQISPGWSHDVFDRDWACIVGKKTTPVPHKTYIDPLAHSFHNEMYKNDHSLIARINRIQRSWRAVAYPEYELYSVEDMLRRAGGRGSRIFSRPKPAPVSAEMARRVQALPESFDWRNVDGSNYVSPIRNQGSCGSCYAFASMAMDEARMRVETNNTQTPVYSTQDVVECSQYSQGCEGGFPYLVSGKYAEDFGLVLEECNPYRGKDGVCSTKKTCRRQYFTKYQYLGGYYGACNEEVMKVNLVKHGPVAVSFEVHSDFFHYKGGIYHFTGLERVFNPFELTNHVVLVVGYGASSTGEHFWIVKNSWGPTWGEDGYFRIRRGTDECGLESIAVQSFPVM